LFILPGKVDFCTRQLYYLKRNSVVTPLFIFFNRSLFNGEIVFIYYVNNGAESAPEINANLKETKMQFRKFYFSRLFFCLTTILCLSAGLFAQRAKQGDFKDLAGPAEEINARRLPDPTDLGTRSKTAMIPFRGAGSLIEIPIESSENTKLLLVSPNASDLDVSIALPGESFAAGQAVGSAETSFGFDGNQYPARAFEINNAKAGKLGVIVRASGNLQDAGNARGYIVVSSDSPYQAYSYIDKLNTVVGREIGFVSAMFDRTQNSDLGAPAALRGVINGAETVVTLPNGKTVTVTMSGNADGSFRGGFMPSEIGKYTAQTTIRGAGADGADFIRTSEHVFQVEKGLAIGRSASVSLIDDVRWQINLPVSGASAGQKLIAHAEVWGVDDEGNEQAVGWVGGMALAERTGKRGFNTPLSLDSRWLARTEMKSYQLKNIRLQNPDSFVVLGEETNLPLEGIYTPKAATESFTGEINDEMRMGKKPIQPVSEAVGGKLMLVHGYCSGDSWQQTAQFTNFVKFLDLNQNRTHDQFANLIKNFGASLPSFGIVAHSQGGDAALHLYTYYWSGLDYAAGARLIQSVGTPYQGTALAGNLAVLGQIFGAGCGANNDLTYSGSAAWLAGIPTWARAKVWYHTTSFTNVWWRYDYCSLATDLFLSDPEDGVVERAYAQLSGGNNMGHKTGWCHTTSMRDPGQTTDSSRNSTMNANAAR
jgi:hypothetical protein